MSRSINNETELIEIFAKNLQKECHEAVEACYKADKCNFMKNPGAYQDATNVFVFRKLAELQLRIQDMEER